VSATKGRGHGWAVAVAGVAVALVVAGYGIWTRDAALTNLQQLAADAAIPRVQVTTPKLGPTARTVTLPGSVVALNEAPIYAQVSGYVTAW
jgi:multidrug efflux pump subunit AcrA (membrane-fusion protein)